MITLGIAAGLLSAASFALNLAFARMAYRYGTDVFALNLSRAVLFAVLLTGFCTLRGLKLGARGKLLAQLLAMGVLMIGQLLALVGALAYAPVGIVMITFFMYPLMVLAAEHGLDGSRPGVLLVGAMVLAFAGVAFVLAPGFGEIDKRGIALAVVASLCFAGLVLVSARGMRNTHPVVAITWCMFVTAGVLLVVSMLRPLAWPEASEGWMALSLSGVLFCIAMGLFFTAVHILGPVRAVILDNTAPVWGIVWGLWLLNEAFAGSQWFGALVVVMAVAVAQWLASRES